MAAEDEEDVGVSPHEPLIQGSPLTTVDFVAAVSSGAGLCGCSGSAVEVRVGDLYVVE